MLKLRAHTDADGRLKLDVPVGTPNHEYDVSIIVEPIDDEPRDEMGYPVGYFEETYGSLSDEPMDRPPQPPLDIRDELE